MSMLCRAAGLCAGHRPFVSSGCLGNTVGFSLAAAIRRYPQHTCDETFVDSSARVKRNVPPLQKARTSTTNTVENFEVHSAGYLPSWQDNCLGSTRGRHGSTSYKVIRYTNYERFKCGYGCQNPVQHGVADIGCICALQHCKGTNAFLGIFAAKSELQLRQITLDPVAAGQQPFCCDAERISSKHVLKTPEEGKRAALLMALDQRQMHTMHTTVCMGPDDPTQPLIVAYVPHNGAQAERRSGANPIPALTIAGAAAFAFPFKWNRHGDAYCEDEGTSNSGADKPGQGSADYYKAIDYGNEDTNCLSQGACSGRSGLHPAMLVGRGFEMLQRYFIRLTEHLGGANGSVVGGCMHAEDVAQRLLFALQYHLRIVDSAVNQAVETIRLAKDKVCNSSSSETTHSTQPAHGCHSFGEREVGTKHTDGGCNIFSGGQSWAAHRTAPYQPSLVGGLPEAAEHSPGVQFHAEQSTLFDANPAYSETNGTHQTCRWWTASYRAIASFLRTMGSVLLRLLYVAPLGLTAATAGFWLLGLPYLSACLRTVGLGSQWVLHWEAIVQHELEEVIFTAVTAAASAAGPTYVKFLQWIATRPDLFHESLCSRCARLQTSVRPFSYPRAALLLREQFGSDWTRHLLLDPTPIGCGCIAQVYRAYLILSNEASEKSKSTFLDHAFVLGGSLSKSAAAEIGSGKKLPPVAVAVKVMRPGVREAMEFDLRLMMLVASALQHLPAFGFVALKKSVEEFAVAMRRQLDFGLEEKHLKLFRSNFGLSTIPIPSDLLPLYNKCRRTSVPRQSEDPALHLKAENYRTNIVGSLSRKILGMRRQVTFPYPFEALSSSEIIVMTLESGFTLNQLFKIRDQLQEQEECARSQRKRLGDKCQNMTKWEQSDTPLAPPSNVAQKIIERFSNVGMICLHSFLQMVFLDNFFHGDMHSGNLLCRFAHKNKELIFPVLPATSPTRLLTNVSHLDGQPPTCFWQLDERLKLNQQELDLLCFPECPLELVVLDCGLAGSLEQADRLNFVTLLEAIARKRGREAALAMLQRAKRSSCQDKEGFCSEVEQLIAQHHFEEGNSLQLSRVRLTSLMGHMLSVSKKYCVELDPSFVSIVVAMSVLEGVGAQLCPDADVLRTALPYSLMAAKLLNSNGSREATD